MFSEKVHDFQNLIEKIGTPKIETNLEKDSIFGQLQEVE